MPQNKDHKRPYHQIGLEEEIDQNQISKRIKSSYDDSFGNEADSVSLHHVNSS